MTACTNLWHGTFTHKAYPGPGATVPGRQIDGCAGPPAQEWPSGQSMQSALLVKLPITQVPGSQLAGMGAALPSGQK